MRKVLTLFIGLALAFSSCEPEIQLPPEVTKATLSITSDSPYSEIDDDGLSGKVAFKSFGGEVTVAVTTDQPSFEVENSGTEWLVIQELTDGIILKAETNDSDTELSATVTITAGEGDSAVSATLEVTQEKMGEISLELDPSEVTISPAGSTEEVTIITDADSWAHTSDSDWLTAEPSGDTLSITAGANTDGERQAEIIITATKEGKQHSETIYVTQSTMTVGGIELSPDKLIFRAQGGSLPVEVITGDEFVIGQPSETWVGATKEGNTLTVTADPNTTPDKRSATIVISTGSGEELKTAILYVDQAGDNPNAMIMVLDIPGDDQLAVLPINGIVDVSVDWGDGKSDTYDGDFRLDGSTAMHTYEKAGTYEVTITGTVSEFHAAAMGITKNYLTEVVQWGKLGVIWMGQAFQDCRNLKSIPSDTQGAFRDAITFDRAFSYTAIESIPADLFKYAVDAQSFVGTFECEPMETEGTITEVPENLFATCPKVTSFKNLFYGQNNLTSIPEGLFANNTLVTDFSWALRHTGITTVPENLFANNKGVTTFAYCFSNTPLTSIPANLFKENTEVDNFEFLFSRCTSLKTLPEDLFRYNTKVKNFYSILAWSGIENVPAGLFRYNTAVTNASAIFYECPDIKTVPAGLFDNMTSVNDLTYIFRGCSKLESIPENLFNFPEVTKVSLLFKDCVKLTTLPSDLFANMPNLTFMSRVFEGCTSLVTIPARLFANLTSLTKMEYMFNGCKALKNIPDDLFENSVSLKEFDSMFRDCTSLEVVPAGLFSPLVNMTHISGMFAGNTSLTTVPVSIFDNNKKISTVTVAFQGCSKLTGESPYTVVNGQKMHLYERSGSGFTYIMAGGNCFAGCTGLSDYSSMPGGWK